MTPIDDTRPKPAESARLNTSDDDTRALCQYFEASHNDACGSSRNTCGIPLVDLAVAPRPERLPQLELLHLAGRGSRQSVGELDPLRALVPGQVRAAVGDDV